MKPIRLFAGFLTVGAWTLLSRILGFVREIAILALIGPGPVMDAFVAAFRLPNMFRRFFAEGAFNAAFVPIFARKYEAGEAPERFAHEAFNALGFATAALTGIAMLFMPALAWITATGFAGDARFDLTIGFGRIVFPYILFMSLAALCSGLLNATGRFAAAAAAPALLNIFVIAAMGLAWALGGDVVIWLVWTIPIAGLAQLALTWLAAARAGFVLLPGWPRFSSDIRLLLVTAVPAALASGVMQINLVVGQLVASRHEGAVSWLFAADRLYQLPLGVVGIAVGIVLLPDLSRRLRANDAAGGRAALSRATEFSMVLTLPAAMALCVIPTPLVSVLFERGATGPQDVAAIARATALYGLGLPAFVLQKVWQPLYFARSDTQSPFRYALVTMGINAALAFGLAPFITWQAPAVAATLSAWSMVGLLWWGARPMGAAARLDSRFWRRLSRLVAATALMGGALWVMATMLHPALATAGLRYAALALLVVLGAGVFFVSAHILQAMHLSELRQALRRG